MSSLKNYVKGLKDTTWTDARASKLDTIPDVGTWTDTRAGYLDTLAGGSLGYKPIATYGYSGNRNFYGAANTIWYNGVGVSVSDWTACFVNMNQQFSSRQSSASFYLVNNTLGYYISVKNDTSSFDYNNVFGVSVTQFG